MWPITKRPILYNNLTALLPDRMKILLFGMAIFGLQKGILHSNRLMPFRLQDYMVQEEFRDRPLVVYQPGLAYTTNISTQLRTVQWGSGTPNPWITSLP